MDICRAHLRDSGVSSRIFPAGGVLSSTLVSSHRLDVVRIFLFYPGGVRTGSLLGALALAEVDLLAQLFLLQVSKCVH